MCRLVVCGEVAARNFTGLIILSGKKDIELRRIIRHEDEDFGELFQQVEPEMGHARNMMIKDSDAYSRIVGRFSRSGVLMP